MFRQRLGVTIAMLLLCPLLIASSCSDEGDTIINSVAPNEPPTIVDQGPEYPAGGIDAAMGEVPTLWVIVGDPNGFKDIGAVMLEVDTVIVSRVVLRPDSAAGIPFSCGAPSYVENDTIAIPGLVPAGFPGLSPRPVPMSQRGLYVEGLTGAPVFSAPFGAAFPEILSLSEDFGVPVKQCFYVDGFEHFGVYPPAVSSPIDAFVTFLDVTYQGITITAYDKNGETAVATFPDLRIRYTTPREQESAP